MVHVVVQVMEQLGFDASDSDRLVASFSGGWQMRICLGKIMLQVGGELSSLEWLRRVLGGGFETESVHLQLTLMIQCHPRAGVALRPPLQDPNLLLLDEPTNHLDVSAIEWLERTALCVVHLLRFCEVPVQGVCG